MDDPWFTETIRLPGLAMALLLLQGTVAAAAAIVLLAAFSPTVGTVLPAALFAAFAIACYVAAAWFIVMHVVVDEHGLRRRVGRRQTRIAFDEIVDAKRLPPTDKGVGSVVLDLSGGEQLTVPTRCSDELVAVLDRGRATTRPGSG